MTRVLSLFDASGVWSGPWAEAGHEVLRFDLSLGNDLGDPAEVERIRQLKRCRVVLAAPPCTVFCRPGARLWRQWDREGRTAQHVGLVEATLDIIEAHKPKVWALENPPGRLSQLVRRLGGPALAWHPWHYAALADDPESERTTKHTYLWGRFVTPATAALAPAPYPKHLPPGGRDPTTRLSSSQKSRRERTPQGFARAFFRANLGGVT